MLRNQLDLLIYAPPQFTNDFKSHSLYHTYIKLNDNTKIEIETQDQGEGKYKYATLTE